MPTSGTHITIVQRLALNALLSPLLGNPDTDPAVTDPNSPQYDPDGYIRMKFACLGAVEPAIFYAIADYGADLQDYENFLIKVGGSFECMSEIMEKTTRYIKGEASIITQGVVDSLFQTSTLLTGVIKNSLLALIVKAGFNFWPFFKPKRQQDRPRNEWYWADFLHYVRSEGRATQAAIGRKVTSSGSQRFVAPQRSYAKKACDASISQTILSSFKQSSIGGASCQRFFGLLVGSDQRRLGC